MAAEKAWHKAFTTGSKSLQDKLRKVHANNPKFQEFLGKHGLQNKESSVKQASKAQVVNKEVAAKRTALSDKAYGATRGVKVGGEHGSDHDYKDTTVPLTKDQHSKVQAAVKAAKPEPEKKVKPVKAPAATKKAPLSKEQRLAAISAAIKKHKSGERFEVPTEDPDDAGYDDLRDTHFSLHQHHSMDESKQDVAEANKHSFIGRIQRHNELKNKVNTSFVDIDKAQQAGDHPAASKAFRKHERYANLERPGTWRTVKEEVELEEASMIGMPFTPEERKRMEQHKAQDDKKESEKKSNDRLSKMMDAKWKNAKEKYIKFQKNDPARKFPIKESSLNIEEGIGIPHTDKFGIRSRGVNLPVAEKHIKYNKYDKWKGDVNHVNSKLLDDNADFKSDKNGEYVTVNGKHIAAWNHNNKNGNIDIRAAKEHSQGVKEDVEQIDELSVHTMLNYMDASEKNRNELNRKLERLNAHKNPQNRKKSWDLIVKTINREAGELRADKSIQKKTGKRSWEIGKLDRAKHAAIAKENSFVRKNGNIDIRAVKEHSQGIVEGALKDIEGQLKKHEQKRIDREKAGDPYVAHEIVSHDLIHKQLLDKRNRIMRKNQKRAIDESSSEERSQNRLWQMINDHEQRAKKTKNDIKKQHHLQMASKLRRQLNTSDDQTVEEEVDQLDKNSMVIKDRKTGKEYDPEAEFEKLQNDPEYIAQMKRMGKEEGHGWPKRTNEETERNEYLNSKITEARQHILNKLADKMGKK